MTSQFEMTQLARILSEKPSACGNEFSTVWPLICCLVSVNWLIYVLSAGGGFANPAQSGANAQLKKTLAHPVWATIAVYVSGLAAMLIIQAFVREGWPSRENFSATSWWAWMGGLLSIASTMAGLLFAQKLGSGVFTGISVTAALASSIVIDHFGWIGFEKHPASGVRIAGSALMICGLWLVAKFWARYRRML